MSITIGDAILYLSSNDDRLNRGLKDAEQKAKTWTSNVGNIVQTGIGTALGFVGAQISSTVVHGLQTIAVEALTSVASYERLGLSLESLVSRELMRGQVVKETSTAIQHLTDAEKANLDELIAKQKIADANVLQLQAAFDSEWKKVTDSGGQWSATLTELEGRITLAKIKAGDYAKEIDALQGKEGQLATITKEVITGQLNQSEAMAQAGPKAKELLEWITKLAVLSPFKQEEVADAFRMAMAYGFTSDEAKRLTESMINFASGSGASAEVMSRIALALGQIKAKGKLAGQEVLQLVNAGLPVTDILAKAFNKTTAEIEAMREQGLIKADDAIKAIVDTLDHDFAGAAERQATSWAGIVSTLSDLKDIGLREFFTGTFKAIQPYLVSFVDLFTNGDLQAKIRDVGDALGEKVKGSLEWLQDNAAPIFQEITKWVEYFFWAVEDGQNPLDVLGKILKTLNLPTDLLDGLTNLSKFWDDNGQKLIDGISSIGESLLGMITSGATKAFKEATEWLVINGPDITKAVQDLATWTKDTLVPALTSLGQWVIDHKDQVIGFLIGLGAAFVTANAAAFTASLIALVNPLTAIALIAGFAAGGLVRYGESILGADAATATFAQKLQVGFWGILNNAAISVATLGAIIQLVFVNGLNNASLASVAILEGLAAVFSAILQRIGFEISTWIGTALADIYLFFIDLGATWQANWDMAALIITTTWANIKSTIDAKITEVKTAVGTFLNDVKKAFDDQYENFKKIGESLIDNVLIGIKMKVSQVIDTVKGMVKDAIEAAGEALGATNPFGGGTEGASGTPNGNFRDSGGPGRAGQAYVINPKAAPELFVPKSDGFFFPNADKMLDRFSSGGQQITNNYYVNDNLDIESVARRVAELVGGAA